MTRKIKKEHTGTIFIVLVVLSVLFVFRVISQLSQYFTSFTFLPSFKQWDSGALPYEVLLIVQLVIVLFFIKTIYKIYSSKIKINSSIGFTLLLTGSLYFTVMLFRLIAGITFLKHISWFAYPIPSIFHMVIALFLIFFGFYHISVKKEVLNCDPN